MKSLIIRPILPRIPVIPDYSSETLVTIFQYSLFIFCAGMLASVLGMYAAKHFKGDKTKTVLAFIGITLAVTALLLCFFGVAVGTLKGILLCLILLFSSYSDIKTRESADWLAVMVALTAFIGTEITDIPLMLLSAVLLTLPMFLIVIVCKGKTIGGADVKLTAACAFLLGAIRGCTGLVAGLTVGIIVNLIIQMKKKKAEGFPLIPYLAAGFMAAYFL